MLIDTVEVRTARIIRPHGRIDSGTSPALEAAIKTGGSALLLLDFSDVSYVSSAGLRVVLIGAKAARAANGGFAVFGVTPSVRTVFKVSGFDRIVSIVDTEAEALAAVGA